MEVLFKGKIPNSDKWIEGFYLIRKNPKVHGDWHTIVLDTEKFDYTNMYIVEKDSVGQ